jgi:hypothetical protein
VSLIEAQPYFLVVQFEQGTLHGGGAFVFVGVNVQRLHNHVAADDPSLRCYVRLGPVECVLRATPLGGYDSSLDDDPESGVTYFEVPLV